QRGQTTEAERYLLQARGLWERLAETGNGECRYWFAHTLSKQDDNNTEQFFQSQQQAEAIWEELAQERPDDLDLMQRIWHFRRLMMGHFDTMAVAAAWLPQLQENRTELEARVRQNPRDRALRKRLALRCVLLGEWSAHTSAERANSFWKQSYD